MIGITKSNISSGRCLVSFKRKSNINSNVITTRWIVNSFLGEAYDGTFQNNASSGSNSLVPQNGENAPRFRNALILPISRRPVFPSFMSAFNIKNEKIANAIINDKSVSQGYVGLFLRKDSNENVEHNELITKFDQIYRVGTYAQVQSAVRTDFGTQLLLIAHRRVSLDRITSFGPPAYGDIIHWNATETINETPKVRALMNELMQVARELIQLNPLLHEHINQMLSRIQISNPNRLADFAASLCSVASGEELQKVLETASTEERLHLALGTL
jgi:Lon-like ATP-dependent protease